ncbi:ATP-binding protein [Labedaea rhizosphaerae]|uniref:Histidine kinase-like protein n=1 Tax=Labedaea rhizosphaerae TaxID=598644 RepID=A0A4R6SER7_LABRH|nr:ATP-binding protein [Labedaea rhizosphaerae]TDQ00422.1 histidine kinase-like protein [Labedaea rhizosphaerae]
MAALKPPAVDEPYGAMWSFDLRGSRPTVLAHVRSWIGAVLEDLGRERLADIVLIADELVANAFDHGGGPHEVRVSRMRTPCWVGIEVDDSGSDQPVLGRSRFPADYRGRGLVVVDNLAQAWGVTTDPDRGVKTVWAHVACAMQPCVPRSR